MSRAYREAFDRAYFLLKKCRPIAFALRFAQLTGHPKAALMLSQLVYWTRHGRDVEDAQGWIHKTREAWGVEVGLSREEQENARRRLMRLNLLEEHRGGRPARMHFRLKADVLSAELDKREAVREPLQLTLEFLRAQERNTQGTIGATMAFYRVLVEVTGSVNAALLLSRMIQLQRSTLDADDWDWFTVTSQEWARDLALHRRQLENAKARLRTLGLIREVPLREGVKRLRSQVDPLRLLTLLEPAIDRHLHEAVRKEQDGARDKVRRVRPVAASSSSFRAPAPASDATSRATTAHRPEAHRSIASQAQPRPAGAPSDAVQKSPTGQTDVGTCALTVGDKRSWSRLSKVGGKHPWLSAGFVHAWRGLSYSSIMYTTTSTTTSTTTACLPPTFISSNSVCQPVRQARSVDASGKPRDCASVVVGVKSRQRCRGQAHGVREQAVQRLTRTRTVPNGQMPSPQPVPRSRCCEKCGVAPQVQLAQREAPANIAPIAVPNEIRPAATRARKGVDASDHGAGSNREMAAARDIALVWPSFISPPERAGIERYLAPIPAADRQVLIDEMAASHREQAVRFPVAYVGRLATRYLSGQFVAAKAHRERAHRQLAAARQAALREQEASFAQRLGATTRANVAAPGRVGASRSTPGAMGTSPIETEASSPETARVALAGLLDGLRRRWQPKKDTRLSARSQGSPRPSMPVDIPKAASTMNRPSHGPGGPDGYFASPEIP
ncbi:hypothetical protein C9I57_30345 [Trinickia symbiotica]|uniref:Uncharacterized protein n=1 Tax=Trinickia symbiotica TaxID=863227 RepID=A0A2T3XKE8_9BURK|nr:hypothetical protein [Trinickia symbiotica]PTB17005.1 hypothetical protein C9I57_30345 [Trinickia symbiotica]